MLSYMAKIPPFFKAEWYSVTCMYYIFFILSCMDEQSGCLPVLAIVSHTAMNMNMLILLWHFDLKSSHIYSGVGLQVHMAILVLNSWGTFTMLPIVPVSFAVTYKELAFGNWTP